MRRIPADSRSTTSTWRASRSQRAANSTALWSWLDRSQVDQRALRFRDDLLRHDEHVTRPDAESGVLVGELTPRVGDQSAEVVSGLDLGNPGQRDGKDRRQLCAR